MTAPGPDVRPYLTGSPVAQRDSKSRAPCPPAGVTIAEPIPADGRSVPTGFDPKKPRVTTHGDGKSIPGGWPGLGKSSKESFRVGETDRILLTGVQIGNAGRAGGTPPSTRAVALVPDSVRANPKGDVAVLVHLHGTKGDKEMTDPNPIDTDEARFDMVGQVESFLKDRPGARLIVLLPRGSTYESAGADGKKTKWVKFGGIDIPTFVSSAISQLQSVLPGATAGGLVLSGHSAGGGILSGMLDKAFKDRRRAYLLCRRAGRWVRRYRDRRLRGERSSRGHGARPAQVGPALRVRTEVDGTEVRQTPLRAIPPDASPFRSCRTSSCLSAHYLASVRTGCPRRRSFSEFRRSMLGARSGRNCRCLYVHVHGLVEPADLKEGSPCTMQQSFPGPHGQ
ncbi:MAG: hypothetical protein ACRDUV_00570 [Pseudonocardiaceae bacterium]